MNDAFEVHPIGVIESCYSEKFGTPRQSGIVPTSYGKVHFTETVDSQACRGLQEFSHIWLVFLFDQVAPNDVRWLVRPPRLGGNEKTGVFATRSPFRPNRIGLSLVKLEKVNARFLEVSGLDLVNETPILDIKPYLPYVESQPDAHGGFAQSTPPKLSVTIPDNISTQLSPSIRQLIIDSLALDPRPAYHNDSKRIYGCKLAGYEVKWQASQEEIEVLEILQSSISK